ncbi:hypothetical protein JNMOADIG_00179 [Aeromonas phage avDM5]|uniref:Nuclease associated modular domain-containing protein n=1 Tax=Aeromonas phage vB_AehM_DM2 TaxID=2973716 RepID=A0AA95C7M9_9CAUD|nr:hypothetical protein JNMOADIG_00179 [Aeromonas phage avDM5]UYD60579.1 hypothetical protein NPHMPGLK_00244 [Aeromonas phage avDM2]UYD60829.1 hypothetical protein NHNEHLNL_00250 [Aeromonas phage avDM2]
MEKGRARGNDRRCINFYVERHHIVPRCMNGSDDDNNMVFLTAAEHFVAHQLLVKIFPENHSIVHAAKILMGSCNSNNKQFEWLRKRAIKTSIEFHTGKKRSKETRDKISKALKGKKRSKTSDQHRLNLSKALKGRQFTEDHRQKLSSRIINEEWRDKISKANYGKKLSDEQLEKHKALMASPEMSMKLKESAKNSPKYTCAHCGITTNRGNHNRWHGDNCNKREN